MRKALIDKQGLVSNVIEIEPDFTYPLPSGFNLIDAGNGSPGDTWDGVKFIKPELPTPVDWQAEWDNAANASKKLEVLAKRLGIKIV